MENVKIDQKLIIDYSALIPMHPHDGPLKYYDIFDAYSQNGNGVLKIGQVL